MKKSKVKIKVFEISCAFISVLVSMPALSCCTALGNSPHQPPFFNDSRQWSHGSSGMDGPPTDMHHHRFTPNPSQRNYPGPAPMREPTWPSSNYPFPSNQGAKREGMPPEQFNKGMPPPPSSGHSSSLGPSPSWGSVQHRDMPRPPYPSGGMVNQQAPFSGSHTLHSVLTQGMPPRRSPHGPHNMPHLPGMKPHKPPQPVFGSSQQKKEIVFPPDSIEATQPVVLKPKRKTSKDIG